MNVAGCWLLDAGCWLLDARSRLLLNLRGELLNAGNLQRHVFRGKRGVRNQTIMQRGLPEIFEASCGILILPISLHNIVRRLSGLIGEKGEHFIGRFAAIKRSNERLHEREGAIERTCVAPTFERMHGGNMPMT